MISTKEKQFRHLYQISGGILVAWTLLIAGSLVWNNNLERQQGRALAIKEARSHLLLWDASHGDVYVPTSEQIAPNPNLEHIPEQNITTPSGKNLTLTNPRYIIQKMMNKYTEMNGIKGKATTFPDKLFNPANMPDEWELASLREFEKGKQEAKEFTRIDGEPYLRLMRPMFIQESCLSCHANQGYKVGDIRGAESISVPMSSYLSVVKRETQIMSVSHGLIWLLGFGSIVAVTRRSKIQIIERLKAYSELMLAKEDAEKGDKAKSEFLASMSHELRTPLNAVLGYAQMMQFDPKNPLSESQNVHVDSILKGGNHLLELVNDILDLGRIESGQFDLSVGDVSANDVVSDCVSMTTPLGEPRGIKIINSMDERSSVFLRTDQVRFKQVLINLLSNAIKFNKDAGTVTIDSRETENGFLRISVTDTGVGIAEKDQENVFRMFHRLGADPMKAQEGSGIGLTVIKFLVERMSGWVGFESKVGVGSTFWLELPLASNKDIIIWDESLSTGAYAIDKDHQIIISLINRVAHQTIEDADLDEAIKGLIDYTNYHFRKEEAIMEVCGYPDLENHRALHRDLTARVNALADKWRKERTPETTWNIRKFLQDWLIKHIMEVDIKIAPYTKGKKEEIRTVLENVTKTNQSISGDY